MMRPESSESVTLRKASVTPHAQQQQETENSTAINRVSPNNSTTSGNGNHNNSNNNNDGAPAPADFDVIDAEEARSPGAQQTEIFARRMHRIFEVTAIPTAVIIGLFLISQLLKAKIEAHLVGRIIAGYCTAMSVVMTALLIYLHLSAYADPMQQRRIIRILLMVPIYSVDSYFALWRYHFSPVVGLVRDCYESYVIYTFFRLLMGYLGGEEAALAARQGTTVSHMVPFCCFPEFKLSRSTFRTWKLLLTQYMIAKPVMSVIAIVLMLDGKYDEASWSFRDAHVYFVIILNVSVTLAFTSLVYFFVEFKGLLQPHKPLGKFAAVKAVVFLTFWQSVVLGILVWYGVVQGSKEGLWTKEEVSTAAQDFLICLEMLAMCYAHRHVFPDTPYVPATGRRKVTWWIIRHAFSVTDVLDETLETVHTNFVRRSSGGGGAEAYKSEDARVDVAEDK